MQIGWVGSVGHLRTISRRYPMLLTVKVWRCPETRTRAGNSSSYWATQNPRPLRIRLFVLLPGLFALKVQFSESVTKLLLPFLPPANEVRGRVMFLHLSVSHYDHGGGGGCARPRQTPLLWTDTSSRQTPPGRHPQGRHPPGQQLHRVVRKLQECILVFCRIHLSQQQISREMCQINVWLVAVIPCT